MGGIGRAMARRALAYDMKVCWLPTAWGLVKTDVAHRSSITTGHSACLDYHAGLGSPMVRVDPAVLKEAGLEGKVEYRASLDELVKESDVVSLHMPLNEKTKHLFGEKYFDMMKPSAILVK